MGFHPFNPGAADAEALAGVTPTAAGLDLLDDSSASAQRNTLGIGHAFDTYAAGTVYSVTNAQAAVAFGTTSPVVTITTAGTYRIRARLTVNYNAATFAAVRNLTVKLRRTNNTAGDLTNATLTVKTQIITTLTFTMLVIDIPEVLYTTTNVDDAVTIFAGLDTGPTAGSLDVVAAEIHAQQVA